MSAPFMPISMSSTPSATAISDHVFTTLFVFGALGAYAGSQAFLLFGWAGVCAVGLAPGSGWR
jgi:hypothetical protein